MHLGQLHQALLPSLELAQNLDRTLAACSLMLRLNRFAELLATLPQSAQISLRECAEAVEDEANLGCCNTVTVLILL